MTVDPEPSTQDPVYELNCPVYDELLYDYYYSDALAYEMHFYKPIK